jgi:CO/xanthine dehydrogenase Mo-binding subunit
VTTIGDPFAQPEIRHEGHLKVTGQAKYTGDHFPPGLLHVACLTSSYAHALLRQVDTRSAEDVPGVHAVLTGRDIGDVRFGRYLCDKPVLAVDRVRHIGERIAAVAAETKEAAEEAARLIEVEYEPLPAVLDPRQALAGDAPVLHPDAGSYAVMRDARRPPAHPNIQGHLVHTHGEPELEAAFQEADLVFEHTFRTPRQHPGYIETHGALVWFEGDVCHVISTNKSPYLLRQQMCVATGHPMEKIVVHNRFIGGDFGGKGYSLDEFVCFYLARATGRPVRSIMSYVDDLATTNSRHAAEIKLRTAVNLDGTFVAHSADLLFDGGAYAAAKPAQDLVPLGGVETMSAYSIPRSRVTVTTVYTNSLPGGHMRSPGEVQALFAGESHVDMIAVELGIDPIELRRRNLRTPEAQESGRDDEAGPVVGTLLSLAANAVDWHAPRPDGRAVGMALYCRRGGTGRGGITVRAVGPDEFEIVTGAADQGSGTVTMLARVAAAALEVAEDRIRVTQESTGSAMFDMGAGASRVTRVLGEATYLAAVELRELLATQGFDPARPLEVSREAVADSSERDGAFGALAVEVHVDRVTGQITVLDAVMAADTGTVINPVAHRGQLEGGFVFGLGGALMEDLSVEDGQVLCGSLGDYKLPTVSDVPPLRIIGVPVARGAGPFGAKGVGELGNLGVAAAIGNAVARATGVRLQELPLSAEAVHAKLSQNRRQAAADPDVVGSGPAG